MNNKLQVATLGGGCFWCTEAVFQEVKGVEKVISGYAIASIISAALLKSILYLEGSIVFNTLFKTLKFSGLIATLLNFIVSFLRKIFCDLKSVVIV